jgi:hypothetical protein
MAKIIAPLFSGAASGRFSNLAEFRMVNGQAIAAGIKERRKPIAPQTEAQASRFKTAANAWTALDEVSRDLWRDAAALQSMSGYNLWIREYLQQGIVPPAQPVIPT